MLRAGQRIGPLRIERPLGAGGTAVVYLARDERLQRSVAVKLLPGSRSLDPDARGRLLREARAASALRHPGIVTVYDVGEHEGLAYIAMEYVDGETFSALVRRRGRMPPAEAIELVAQVGEAVATAHAAGVLHRDIKSANLMIDADGRVKVLDFGLSKRTDPITPVPGPAEPVVDISAATLSTRGEVDDRIPPPPDTPALGGAGGPPVEEEAVRAADLGTYEPHTVAGTRMGTPGWAPPELIEGRPAEVRSDVFALGCVLYHLLTGEAPFPGETWSEVRAQIERGPVPPSHRADGIPAALDAVVLGALAVDPAHRPDDARALVAAARAALAPRSRRRVAFAAGAVALVAGGVGVYAMTGRAADPASPTAPAATPAAAPVPEPPAPVPEVLTATGGCAYSPTFMDEDTLVFDLTRDNKVDLYRLDLGAPAPVQLTSSDGWEWRSSRGRSAQELVFLSQNSKDLGIDTLDLSTLARRRLLVGSGAVVFTRGAYFHAPPKSSTLMRAQDGRDEVVLTVSGGRDIDTMAASPDGRRLAVTLRSSRSPFQLCTVDLDDMALTCAGPEPLGARPAFSSTSDAVYFDTRAGILRLPIDGGAADPVIRGVVAYGGIAVSPAGRSLVYSTCRSRTRLISPLDDARMPFIDDPSAITLDQPALGAGGLLAFVHGGGDEVSVRVRRPDGTIITQVAGRDQRFTGLAFSPEGGRLAYVLGDAKAPGIYLAEVGQHLPVNRLTTDPSDSGPVFVGRNVLFTRWNAAGVPRLMQVGPDGTGEAPAGTRPRFTIDSDHAHGRVLLGSPARNFLYWWDPRTGKETRGPHLPDGSTPADVALSPDGRWLLIMAGNNGQKLWRVRTDVPGATEELVHELAEDVSALVGAIDDRGHPLVAVDSWSGELWLAKAPAGRPW